MNIKFKRLIVLLIWSIIAVYCVDTKAPLHFIIISVLITLLVLILLEMKYHGDIKKVFTLYVLFIGICFFGLFTYMIYPTNEYEELLSKSYINYDESIVVKFADETNLSLYLEGNLQNCVYKLEGNLIYIKTKDNDEFIVNFENRDNIRFKSVDGYKDIPLEER